MHTRSMVAVVAVLFMFGARDTAAEAAAAVPARTAFPVGARFPATLATPYRAQLPQAERLAGLALIWSTARDHFVWFDHAPGLDWDRAYLEAMPRVLAARDTAAYYRELERFVALLRDGHSNVYLPPELSARFQGWAGVRTMLIEGRVIVTDIANPALAAHGLRVGDELLDVDGTDVHRHVRLNVLPFQSASSPQDLAIRAYRYALLAGPAARPVRLGLRHADGKRYMIDAPRSGFKPVNAPREQFELREDGVAVLVARQFESRAAAELLERNAERLLAAKAFIIDLRGNGGGSGEHGWELLSWLSPEPITTPRSLIRDGNPYQRAHSADPSAVAWRQLDDEAYVHVRARRFEGPVAMLIDERSFSAAEDTAAAFKMMKRGPLIGMATAGSTGQPLFIDLPGGGRARICVKRDSYPDGSDFIGVGVKPDIELAPSVESVRAGRDPVLERALRVVHDAAEAGR